MLWERREAKHAKLLQYGERVLGITSGSESERIRAAIDATRAFFERMGIPTRLTAYGVGGKHRHPCGPAHEPRHDRLGRTPGSYPRGQPADSGRMLLTCKEGFLELPVEPLILRNVTLPNRIAVSPMCQYSALDGLANDWHLVHLGGFAQGGAGLVLTEATAVLPEGGSPPKTLACGPMDRSNLAPDPSFHQRPRPAAGSNSPTLGARLNTRKPWAGEPGTVPINEGGWSTVGPSAIAFDPQHQAPAALGGEQIGEVVKAFIQAAQRALEAGFQVVEIHAAHGYLLPSVPLPLSNQRPGLAMAADSRTGSGYCSRSPTRFVRSGRGSAPAGPALGHRLGGWGLEPRRDRGTGPPAETAGGGPIDVSSGGTAASAKMPVGPGYQTRFAERVRQEAGIPSSTVGIDHPAGPGRAYLRTGQADLVMLGRSCCGIPAGPCVPPRSWATATCPGRRSISGLPTPPLPCAFLGKG